jgi:hypothetical protein
MTMLLPKTKSLLAGLCSILMVTAAEARQADLSSGQAGSSLITPFAKNMNPAAPLPDYPRPQLQRKNWQNLNGKWEYAIVPDSARMPAVFQGSIVVPFPVESMLSGVRKPLLPGQALWYQRSIHVPAIQKNQDFILHFGAVDFHCEVYLNGKLIGKHQGGYTAFEYNGNGALVIGKNILTVKVLDPTNAGFGPHGKQVLKPESIYYTASSGIWQTVWCEWTPSQRIGSIGYETDIDQNTVRIKPALAGNVNQSNIVVSISAGGKPVVRKTFKADEHIEIPLKNATLWSPENPHLYQVSIQLQKNGKTIDDVKSYFGMRKIEIKKDADGIDKIFLNNFPYYNLGVLDQGFWPDGLYTAPTDEALRFDIAMIKKMGFNTIRKHIKVEPARWYYHADQLGLLVWQDFVNPNQGLPDGAKKAFETELKATMDQLKNHPCITTWVVFNEKWGQYDQQRVTEMVKQLDPSRLVNGHSGELLYVNDQLRSPAANPFVSADMTDVHSYPFPRPGHAMPGKAMVLGEFGGMGVPINGHVWNDAGWGYDGMGTIGGLAKKYEQMTDSLLVLKKAGLSGSIYTQPFDVEGEQNGLISYDRKVVKLRVDQIRAINNKIYANAGFDAPIAAAVLPESGEEVLQSYYACVKKYESGVKDSAFLLQLAYQTLGDKTLLRRIMDDYATVVKDPFSPGNLAILMKAVDSAGSKSFQMIWQNQVAIRKTEGEDKLQQYFASAVFNSVMGYLKHHGKSGMDTIQRRIYEVYGEMGDRQFLVAAAFHFYFGNDYPYFVKVKSESQQKYPGLVSIYDTNNDAWMIFQKVQDPALLESALSWSKIVIDQEPSANHLDTYANLLYKLGRKEEAIRVQEKVLKLEQNEDFERNLQLMKQGKPTW